MKFRLVWWLFIAILAGLCPSSLEAASYKLIDGRTMTGELIAPNGQGIIFKLGPTTLSQRIGWTNFTETALKELSNDPKIRPFVEPFIIEEVEDDPASTAALSIKAKTGDKRDRPDPNASITAIFGSTLSIIFLVILYGANIFAGYEVGIFRNYNPLMTGGIAAVLPVLGPLIFLCLPTNVQLEEEEEEEYLSEEEVDQQLEEEEAAREAARLEAEQAAAEAEAAAAPQGPPPPTVYQRGHVTFNRRFFETKLAGFMRVVPNEEDKDMLICIESARGNYVGTRLAKVVQNELFLLVEKNGATSEVSIPFTEIKEVQIRHKDA